MNTNNRAADKAGESKFPQIITTMIGFVGPMVAGTPSRAYGVPATFLSTGPYDIIKEIQIFLSFEVK